MIFINDTGYKGIKEISGISTNYNQTESLQQICSRLNANFGSINSSKYNTLIFNGAVYVPMIGRGNYTKDLANLIKKNGLGQLVKTGIKFNPNSWNKIEAYLWNVDKKALAQWYSKNT